jgi:hypothetical protein
MPQKKKKSVPAQPYQIGKASWGGGKWSVYLPNHTVWSSLEETPERLMVIYGGSPTNLKELQKLGHCLPTKEPAKAVAKPSKRRVPQRNKK